MHQGATAKNKLCNHLDRTASDCEKGWPPLSDPVINRTMADGNNGVRAQPAPDTSYIRATHAGGGTHERGGGPTTGGGGTHDRGQTRKRRCRKASLDTTRAAERGIIPGSLLDNRKGVRVRACVRE